MSKKQNKKKSSEKLKNLQKACSYKNRLNYLII